MKFWATFCFSLTFALLADAVVFASDDVSSPQALADSCPLLSEWLKLKQSDPYSAATVRERLINHQTLSAMREKTAQTIFRDYVGDNLSSDFFKNCIRALPKVLWKDLEPSFVNAFLEGSKKLLNDAHLPSGLKFLSLLKKKEGEKDLLVLPFSVLETAIAQGHQASSEKEQKGGFVWGSGEVFMWIDRIQPSEWLLYFVHEMSHRLDPILAEAIEDLNKPRELDHIKHWASEYSDLQKLKASNATHSASTEGNDKELRLRNYLVSGLNAALLAEYRAWTVSYFIYTQALHAGLWRPIKWVDQILAQKKDLQSLNSFIFEYYDRRFPYPDKQEPFSQPLLRLEFEEIHQELLKSAQPPEMGLLGTICGAEYVDPRSEISR